MYSQYYYFDFDAGLPDVTSLLKKHVHATQCDKPVECLRVKKTYSFSIGEMKKRRKVRTWSFLLNFYFNFFIEFLMHLQYFSVICILLFMWKFTKTTKKCNKFHHLSYFPIRAVTLILMKHGTILL